MYSTVILKFLELMLYLLVFLLVKKLACMSSFFFLIDIYVSLCMRKEEASFVFTINVS